MGVYCCGKAAAVECVHLLQQLPGSGERVHAADVGGDAQISLPRLFQPLLWMPARQLAAAPLEVSHVRMLLQCDGLNPTGGSTSNASYFHAPHACSLTLVVTSNAYAEVLSAPAEGKRPALHMCCKDIMREHGLPVRFSGWTPVLPKGVQG